jgi:hypothetical protein
MSSKVMNEKQAAEEFDEPDDEEILEGDAGEDEVDLARLSKDMDLARRRSARQGMPALRKLEQLAEQKRTAELTSDFDDYELDDDSAGPARVRYGMGTR